jgi:hypothetical protein
MGRRRKSIGGRRMKIEIFLMELEHINNEIIEKQKRIAVLEERKRELVCSFSEAEAKKRLEENAQK